MPPKKYGGSERIVYTLTEELIKRGHEVTLFASGDSQTSAKLVSVYPRSLREAKIKDMYDLNDLTLLHLGTPYTMEDQFDIVHDHIGVFSLPVAQKSKTPVLMTLHGPFTATNRRLYSTFRNPYLAAISRSQVKFAPPVATVAGVVYNGLAMDGYPYSSENDGYLLFVGRISMEKGTHHAIEVAQNLDLPLIIAAKLDLTDVAYFNEYVGPQLSDDRIRWIGEVDEVERNKLMSRALCLLHPITWREPFGLTMIEAMACGCPVIAFNKGSILEIVVDGKTGFIVEDLEGMIEAVSKVGSIDRSFCRRYALDNFNASRMTDGYEDIYRRILENKK
ncbi:MAG: glycosyltransferase family 4 protein [Patescibacteria group bacterium]|nr:glycosyltransferase family 4 protein [Patescibacteria group bacterium]